MTEGRRPAWLLLPAAVISLWGGCKTNVVEYGTDEDPDGGAALSSGGAAVDGRAGSDADAGRGGAVDAVSVGGAGRPDECVPVDPYYVIADFESGLAEVHHMILDMDVWHSDFEFFNDGTAGGMQTPVKPSGAPAVADGPGACGTSHSLHTTASGYPNAAGFAAEYFPVFEGEPDACWAVLFRGIAFYARAANPTRFRVSLPDVNTAEAGGVCNPDAGEGERNRCGDHFGAEVLVTTEWQLFKVAFADTMQAGWGDNGLSSVELRALHGIRFEAAGETPHEDYELWVDEIQFWDGGAEACAGQEATATGAAPLIDDLEDCDPFLPERDGRLGFWYVANDETGGVQNPMPMAIPSREGANGSACSMHTWGHGFTSWGALVGFSPNERGRIPCPYDASAHDGISFYAKGGNGIKFRIATVPTSPPELGGNCTTHCFNAYGANIILSPEWELHTVRWGDLEQETAEPQVPFDPAEILQIQFETYPMEEFDFYIDDVRFLLAAE